MNAGLISLRTCIFVFWWHIFQIYDFTTHLVSCTSFFWSYISKVFLLCFDCPEMKEQRCCFKFQRLFILFLAAAAAKSLQSCPTLCDPTDSSPPGSAVPGILQARALEWVAISFSIAWKWKVKVKSLSRDRLVVTPWTVAHQAPPCMGFSRQEYWSGLPLPSPILFLTNWLVRQFRDLLSVTKNDLDAWLISF